MNVDVKPIVPTVPVTGVPPSVFTTLKLAVVNVELRMRSEKVADTKVSSVASVEPLAGTVEATVGGVVSGAAPVVNFQLKGDAMALPAASFAVVLIVAVYSVLPA